MTETKFANNIHALLQILVLKTKADKLTWILELIPQTLPNIVFQYETDISPCAYFLYVRHEKGVPKDYYLMAHNLDNDDTLYVGPEHVVFTEELQDLHAAITRYQAVTAEHCVGVATFLKNVEKS